MRFLRRCLPALVLAASPLCWASGNYVGVLKPTAALGVIAIPEPGFYWPRQSSFDASLSPSRGAEGFRLKLGYRYSRFVAFETGYSESATEPFRASLMGPALRSRGFSMDTIGTLPLWSRASLYGRLGAWHNGSAPLLAGWDGAQRPGTGLRYGLGFKVDFTRKFGMQADVERFSSLGRLGPRESDTDQVSVGVTWRF